jgi:choline dehydrogenase-like flavoprotein
MALHDQGTKSVGESGNTAQSGKRTQRLAAVPPIAAADRYAAVLTDAVVATLKHLAGTLPTGNHPP